MGNIHDSKMKQTQTWHSKHIVIFVIDDCSSIEKYFSNIYKPTFRCPYQWNVSILNKKKTATYEKYFCWKREEGWCVQVYQFVWEPVQRNTTLAKEKFSFDDDSVDKKATTRTNLNPKCIGDVGSSLDQQLHNFSIASTSSPHQSSVVILNTCKIFSTTQNLTIHVSYHILSLHPMTRGI